MGNTASESCAWRSLPNGRESGPILAWVGLRRGSPAPCIPSHATCSVALSNSYPQGEMVFAAPIMRSTSKGFSHAKAIAAKLFKPEPANGAERESFRHSGQAVDSAKFLPCDFLLGCCRHQLIAKFFRSDSQAFDVLLLVSFFERSCPFIDVRLPPPQQAVNQGSQFPGGSEHRHVSPDPPCQPPIVGS